MFKVLFEKINKVNEAETVNEFKVAGWKAKESGLFELYVREHLGDKTRKPLGSIGISEGDSKETVEAKIYRRVREKSKDFDVNPSNNFRIQIGKDIVYARWKDNNRIEIYQVIEDVGGPYKVGERKDIPKEIEEIEIGEVVKDAKEFESVLEKEIERVLKEKGIIPETAKVIIPMGAFSWEVEGTNVDFWGSFEVSVDPNNVTLSGDFMGIGYYFEKDDSIELSVVTIHNLRDVNEKKEEKINRVNEAETDFSRHKEYAKKLKELVGKFEPIWKEIVELTNKYIEEGKPYTYDEFLSVGIEDIKKLDDLALSWAWVVDRLAGKYPRDRGSATKKIRNVLGYTYP